MEAVEEYDSASLAVFASIVSITLFVRVFYLFCGRLLASDGGVVDLSASLYGFVLTISAGR